MFFDAVIADWFLLYLFGGFSWSLLNIWIEERDKKQKERWDKMREEWQKNKKEDEEIMDHAYNLVFSSTRPMPAYFCDGKDGRRKSFQIHFESLNESDEGEMACQAYQSVEDFYKNPRNTQERTWVVRLGEDAMIGAYIISKLGRPGLSVDLEKRITKENVDRFRGQNKDLDVDLVLKEAGVREYLDYCIEIGKKFVKDKK